MYQKFMILGLIYLWNNCGMGCSMVIMSWVEVVVCWGFDALVWSSLFFDLWVVSCVRCVVLICVVLVL